MIKVEYQLTKHDVLQLYLYRSAHLDLNRRLRKRNRLIFLVAWLALALLLCFSRHYVMACVFAVMGVAWFAVSPVLLRWRLRKYYEKYIDENCEEWFRQPISVELRPEGMHLSSHVGESLCRYSAIDNIAEDGAHTFVFIGKSSTLILPHNAIPADTLRSIVSEIEHRQRTGEEEVSTC